MTHWLWLALRTFLELDALLWLIITALALWLLPWRGAVRFSGVQLLSTNIGTPVGWVVLILPCALHAWKMQGLVSTKDGRPIDSCTVKPIQATAGNIEDGFSASQALIWDSSVSPPVLVPYMPVPTWAKRWRWSIWVWQSLRAYLWSGWRNSVDQLKYYFAWAEAPPAVEKTLGSYTLKIGWKVQTWGRRANVPILSLSKT